jgi:hypothetical protein
MPLTQSMMPPQQAGVNGTQVVRSFACRGGGAIGRVFACAGRLSRERGAQTRLTVSPPQNDLTSAPAVESSFRCHGILLTCNVLKVQDDGGYSYN